MASADQLNRDRFNFLLSLPIVFSYLTLADALRLREVSSQLRYVTSRVTNHLWMDRDEEAERNSQSQRRTPITCRRMRYLLEIFSNIDTMRIVGLNTRTPRILGEIVNGKLECLELWDTVEVGDQWKSKTVGNVEGSFPWCDPNHNQRFPQLKKLAITGTLTSKKNQLTCCLLRACPKLTALTLGNISHLSDNVVEEAILKPLASTLKRLTLNDCGGMFLPVIQSGILETLILTGSTSLRGLDRRSFCPRLEVLNMSHCFWLGVGGLCSMEKCLFDGVVERFCPRLRTLNLAKCISIKSIQTSLLDGPISQSNTDRLEFLDLSWCAALESVSISSAILKHLDLTHCNVLRKAAISSHALEKFQAPGISLAAIYLNCPSLVSMNLTGREKLSNKKLVMNCPVLKSINGQKLEMKPQQLNKTRQTSSRWGVSTLSLSDYLIWREYNIRF